MDSKFCKGKLHTAYVQSRLCKGARRSEHLQFAYTLARIFHDTAHLCILLFFFFFQLGCTAHVQRKGDPWLIWYMRCLPNIPGLDLY